MKKFISVTVLLTFLTASMFAVPVTDTVSPVTGENNLEADLFSNVQAAPLTDLEMEAVEGEGWITGTLCLLGAGALIVLGSVTNGLSVFLGVVVLNFVPDAFNSSKCP